MRPRITATSVVAGATLVGALLSTVPATAQDGDPPYSVDEDLLAAALDCVGLDTLGPDQEPMLLVHGTFTAGHEQWDWNYGVFLPDRGIPHCIVTYPGRGFGDMQESAEYVVHAIRTIHDETGRLVDVVGHSQGAILPRWAVTFWPSARAAVDDLIGIAGPHHGTSFGDMDGAEDNPFGQPPVFWQFAAGSNFYRALNAGDETPGDIDWTQIYTQHDELVQPTTPVPTAALDFGAEEDNVVNVLIQDHCPARVVDHVTIGTTDLLVFEMVVAAATTDGPLDVAAMGLGPDCNVATNLVGDPLLVPAQLAGFRTAFEASQQAGPGDTSTVDEEPPLKPYADPDREPDPAPEPEPSGDPDPAPVPEPSSAPSPAAAPAADDLPATGGGLVLGAFGALAAAAVMRRRPD